MIKTPRIYESACIEQLQKVVAEAVIHCAEMNIKDWEFLAAMAEISYKQGNHQKAQAWGMAAHLLHHFAVDKSEDMKI